MVASLQPADIRILAALQEDGRLSNADLAEKAMDAGVKSDLKNLATLQETYLVDNPTGYAGTLAPLQATPYSFKESEAGSISVVSGNATAYCLSGKAANSSTTYYYDSDGGGLSETVCS